MSRNIRIHIFHKWDKWLEPELIDQNIDGVYKIWAQRRICLVCGKVAMRKL